MAEFTRHVGASSVPIKATGSSITAGNSGLFTWPRQCAMAWVQLKSHCTATLSVLWNSDDVLPATACHELNVNSVPFCTNVGGIASGVNTTKVAIYSDKNVTYGTDFLVFGYEFSPI